MTRRMVSVNERNQPCGESHGEAKWTDHEVDLVRDLYSDGFGYKRISRMMDMPRSTVRAICRGDIRSTHCYREREANHG